MMVAKLTRAEQLARHRAIFVYAREHNLTLAEAERAMVRKAWEAANEKLRIVRACGRRSGRTHAAAVVDAVAAYGREIGLDLNNPPPANAPWMMRDLDK